MITANEILRARMLIHGIDYEVRQCQFVEGGNVLFVGGVVSPLCRSCGPSYQFSDLRFDKADLEELAADEALALVVQSILVDVDAKRTKAPE